MNKTVMMIAALALTAGCQSVPDEPMRASAGLQPTKGSKVIGEVTFEQVGNRVRVLANVARLKPGASHGFHIHEVGDCSSGDGMSAKGHFNPYGKPHGSPTGGERHAGDLPMLVANKAGRAKIDVMLDVISVGSGPGNIVGRSVIVHAGPDDFRTQPTGNSGARLACGVIRAN
ncbi:MAG: superoxide dismutase family protein [Burkholderiales bacterium]